MMSTHKCFIFWLGKIGNYFSCVSSHGAIASCHSSHYLSHMNWCKQHGKEAVLPLQARERTFWLMVAVAFLNFRVHKWWFSTEHSLLGKENDGLIDLTFWVSEHTSSALLSLIGNPSWTFTVLNNIVLLHCMIRSPLNLRGCTFMPCYSMSECH